MTAPGGWAADPPELNSAGFWCGPGASSFMAAATQLEGVAAGITALLAGDLATAAALGVSWPSPTGAVAVAANIPHCAWLAETAGLLAEHAAKIASTGTAFETLKAATPTPAEVELNQSTHMILEATNFLGINTPAIVANRAQYFGDYWVRSASNKYSYAAASASGVGSIEPVQPPLPTSLPMGGGMDPSSAAQPSGGSDPSSMMDAPMQMMMPLVSQVGQIGSQAGQMLSGGGGLSSLTQAPMQMMSPLMSGMGSFGQGVGDPAQLGALSGPGVGAAEGGGTSAWAGGVAPALGGPVSASLIGGGGGGGGLGGGGFGGGGVSAALRGPLSWSSQTVPTGVDTGPRTLTTAAVTPAPAGGMSGGGMMAPMAAASRDDKDEQTRAQVMASIADWYREPVAVPIVTGSAGALPRRAPM